jgi:hypothetical protein
LEEAVSDLSKNIINSEERYRNESVENIVITYKIKYSYLKINIELMESHIFWFLDPRHVRTFITYAKDR